MKEPRLSICIVSWNTRQLLLECLKSVFADPQASAWEVIVVDNGSRDGSPEAVRRDFPRVDLVESRENLFFRLGLFECESQFVVRHRHGNRCQRVQVSIDAANPSEQHKQESSRLPVNGSNILWMLQANEDN